MNKTCKKLLKKLILIQKKTMKFNIVLKKHNKTATKLHTN